MIFLNFFNSNISKYHNENTISNNIEKNINLLVYKNISKY